MNSRGTDDIFGMQWNNVNSISDELLLFKSI
jgi:hypothetical protein